MADKKTKWRASQICEDLEHYQVKLKDEDRLKSFGKVESNDSSGFQLLQILLPVVGFGLSFLFLINSIIGLNEHKDHSQPYSSPSLDSFPISP